MWFRLQVQVLKLPTNAYQHLLPAIASIGPESTQCTAIPLCSFSLTKGLLLHTFFAELLIFLCRLLTQTFQLLSLVFSQKVER